MRIVHSIYSMIGKMKAMIVTVLLEYIDDFNECLYSVITFCLILNFAADHEPIHL